MTSWAYIIVHCLAVFDDVVVLLLMLLLLLSLLLFIVVVSGFDAVHQPYQRPGEAHGVAAGLPV